MKGTEIVNASPLLRLLFICDSCDWRHLPVAGGIYEQHPDFLDGMLMLKNLRAKHEEEKRRKEEAKSKAEMGRGRRGRR